MHILLQYADGFVQEGSSGLLYSETEEQAQACP